jgi:Protein of unknown function (DUF1488)
LLRWLDAAEKREIFPTPLSSISEAPRAAFGEVSFLMREGDRTVRVDVSRELLTYLQGFNPGSREANLSWFQRHRERIERAASSKYDDGDYQRYANSCVVRIRLADYYDRG